MEFELWLVCHLTVSSILNIHTFSPKAGDNLATNVYELHPLYMSNQRWNDQHSIIISS